MSNIFRKLLCSFLYCNKDVSFQPSTINLLVGANYRSNEMLTLAVESRHVLAGDFNQFTAKVGITCALK